MHPNFTLVAALASAGLILAPNAVGQLKSSDKNEIKEMLSGELYLRMNLPCLYKPWRFSANQGAVPVAEVSPSGVGLEKSLKERLEMEKAALKEALAEAKTLEDLLKKVTLLQIAYSFGRNEFQEQYLVLMRALTHKVMTATARTDKALDMALADATKTDRALDKPLDKALADAAKANKAPGGGAFKGAVYWGFGPNDLIHFAKPNFKEPGVIEIWAEGVKPRNNTELKFRFVNIQSMQDFRRAYGLVLSRKALQDENPDWPEDIRQAVAARKLLVGMTQAQAFAVVGAAIGSGTLEENGVKVEAWLMRQDRGVMAAVVPAAGGASWGNKPVGGTGFPGWLRFANGKLTDIGPVIWREGTLSPYGR